LLNVCEHSDYALSKLLGSALNDHSIMRPQSVMSVSSTVTSSSSTGGGSVDEKTSSGLGESLSESNGGDERMVEQNFTG